MRGTLRGTTLPRTSRATVGDTVTWANKDAASHTVTSNTAGLFDSGNMVSGDSFSHTFSQAGTFSYVCTYHPWMKGNVTVSP
ncbi:MAG: plastocyanin [Thaumarchaeota archaeon]|nr:plastocyanin [Nitrososphaerota archaeon]